MSTRPARPDAAPLVEMAGITVDHGPVRALHGVEIGRAHV